MTSACVSFFSETTISNKFGVSGSNSTDFFLKSLLLLSVFQICIFPKCAISAVDSFISCWSFLPRLLYFFPSQFLQHTTWPTRWPWGRFSSVLRFTACILAIVSFIACWLFLPSQKFPQHPSHNALWVNLVWSKYILKKPWLKWCGRNCDSPVPILQETAWENMQSHGCQELRVAMLTLSPTYKLPGVLIKCSRSEVGLGLCLVNKPGI